MSLVSSGTVLVIDLYVFMFHDYKLPKLWLSSYRGYSLS